MFGHSYTLRQLWGVCESLPLLQGPRQQGPESVAIGLPGHGQGPRGPAFLTDTPAEVMQLPVQDVADSKEQMILWAVCDEHISVPVESLQQFPEVYKALMDRIGGPGALAEVKVNWRCNTKQWWVGAVPDSVAPSIYRKLGYTNDMIKLMHASTPYNTCTCSPPFVFGMSFHGVTELRTRPHSMCAQKTCFISTG